MPILQQQQVGTVRWAVWQIDESEAQLRQLFSLSQAEEDRLKDFTAPHRRLEWLAVRALLYRISDKELEICYNENGKPYIADGSYHIGISHTKGYAAIILSPNIEVGIDIEQYGRRVEKVTSHYLRADEKPTIYEGEQVWSLLLHWSAKETIYKCLNLLEVDLIKHLRIFPFQVQKEGVFRAVEYRTPQQHEYDIHYQLHPDFVLTYTWIEK